MFTFLELLREKKICKPRWEWLGCECNWKDLQTAWQVQSIWWFSCVVVKSLEFSVWLMSVDRKLLWKSGFASSFVLTALIKPSLMWIFKFSLISSPPEISHWATLLSTMQWKHVTASQEFTAWALGTAKCTSVLDPKLCSNTQISYSQAFVGCWSDVMTPTISKPPPKNSHSIRNFEWICQQ